MKPEIAVAVKNLALTAIENFSGVLELINPGDVSAVEYERVKRAVGELIGETDVKLLSIVYQQYPDLDHLA